MKPDESENTEPNTPLAKLLEATLERVLDRRLLHMEARIAGRVVNALGTWRYQVDQQLADHETRLQHLEHALRTMDTLPPPPPSQLPPGE